GGRARAPRAPTPSRPGFPAPRGAWYRPAALIVPLPLASDQVNAGCTAMGLPNWSRAWPVNCWVAPVPTLAEPGLTTMTDNVWFTVTVTWLVALPPLAFRTLAWKVYVRAWVN